MFLGASQVKLFYFTPFSRKRLQTAPEAGEEALPNGALLYHLDEHLNNAKKIEEKYLVTF